LLYAHGGGGGGDGGSVGDGGGGGCGGRAVLVVGAAVVVEVLMVCRNIDGCCCCHCWGTSRFFVGHLASLRHTMTEAETHNERLCAHTVGDHTGHAYPCVCANVCMWGMCIFK
jgi:hypothetical protein